MGFRHNPYVGTFHRVNYIPFNSEIIAQSIMSETKRNPLIGLIRHSPSTVRKNTMKGVVHQSASSRVLSRIHFARYPQVKETRSNFVASLKELSHSIYSCEEFSSTLSDNQNPACVICLEPYLNGDELLTLNCGHCYHSECVSKWFFQDCLNSCDLASSFVCPQCRKQRTDTTEYSTIGDEGIASLSLLRMGQNLIEEGGYDLLNDVGLSDIGSSEHKSPIASKELVQSSYLGSNYSDCGFPIMHCK